MAPPGIFSFVMRSRPGKKEAKWRNPSRSGGRLNAGEEKTFTQTIRLPNARLWSPEDPFLYVVESSSGGDSVRTRFGMREFRFDNATGRGYLNGKVYYLRGGNIELGQYMCDDPKCGSQPWDARWVRKLVAEIPKRLHWNAFRYNLSVMPEMWLDIADEEGILVQYEPTLWGYRQQWDLGEMIKEYGRWMRDNWNHPCVFMWDSSNETTSPELVKIVKAVRGLDLSDRAWDNSWSPPYGPKDPFEAHPYLFSNGSFDLRKLNDFHAGPAVPRGHASIINEYAWLWLWSDGTPLYHTKSIYDAATPNGTADQRMEFRWYMTAALTELWRTERCAVAVMDYTYLGSFAGRDPLGPLRLRRFRRRRSLAVAPGL